jgi:hypothetical protein
VNEFEAALYSRLTGGTSITSLLAGTDSIYNQQAPPGAAYPLIVFQYQGGGDENKSPHRAKNMLYTIKAISADGLTDAGTIDAAVDTELHLGTALTVSGWTNFWLAREGEIRLVEATPEGNRYYHAGGIYRARIAK